MFQSIMKEKFVSITLIKNIECAILGDNISSIMSWPHLTACTLQCAFVH